MHGQYDISIWILSVFFTLSANFSMLVINPRFRNPKPSSGLPTNLLFIGSVTTLRQEEFVNTLKGELQNNNQTTTLIMRDIYQIGKVPDKKLVNLGLSYLSLGAGIIVSAISFSIWAASDHSTRPDIIKAEV